MNVQSDENLNKINSDLYEIKGILDKNLNLLLDRENKLEDLRTQANVLKISSEKMLKSAEQTRRKMQLTKYLFYFFVLLIFAAIFVGKIIF